MEIEGDKSNDSSKYYPLNYNMPQVTVNGPNMSGSRINIKVLNPQNLLTMKNQYYKESFPLFLTYRDELQTMKSSSMIYHINMEYSNISETEMISKMSLFM